MKNKLRIIAMSLYLCPAVFAQDAAENNSAIILAEQQSLNILPQSRSMSCGPDTLLYSYLKEAYDPGLDTFYSDPMVGPNRAWSQGFLSGGSVSISGIMFWGNVQDQANPSQTINVKAYLYSVNSSFMPVAKIDSATIVVGTSQTLYTGLFAAPVNVTSDYAVVIQNPVSSDTLSVIINNGKTSTYGEGLAWRRYGSGVWNTAAVYAGQDLEPVIAPIVRYNVASDYTFSPSVPVCLGTPISFTNTSSSTAALGNRMYNFSVFADHWGAAGISDSTYAWDMGDGTPMVWTASPSYTHVSAGTLNVTLVTITGLFTNCIDIKGASVVVMDTATAAFTFNTGASPTVSFTNTSSNAATISWDFGDGSAPDNTTNPSHTYASPGTYTVTLTVSDINGCNTHSLSQLVTITTVGIEEKVKESVHIYPNPSSGLFRIESTFTEAGNVEIYNLPGEKILQQQVNAGTNFIDLSAFAGGIYSARFSIGSTVYIQQLSIIK